MPEPQIVELDDRWELHGLDHEVWQLRIDVSTWLILNSDITVHIEEMLTLRRGDASVLVEPGAASVAEIVDRLWVGVSAVRMFKDGRLEMPFADGVELSVAAGEAYESWNVRSSSGLWVISVPDGALSVFLPGSDVAVDGNGRIIRGS